jgi:hypothetical protein
MDKPKSTSGLEGDRSKVLGLSSPECVRGSRPARDGRPDIGPGNPDQGPERWN